MRAFCAVLCVQRGSKVVTVPEEGHPRDGGLLMDVNMAQWLSRMSGHANQVDRLPCTLALTCGLQATVTALKIAS